MAKVEKVLTKTELGITQSDQDLERGFVNMIFGDPEQGELIGGNEIVIKNLTEVEKCATTGDFFGSATMITSEDGITKISFKAPEINEEKAVSPDDKVIIDEASEPDPTKRKLLQKMLERAKPIKHLMRRVRLLEQNFGATMATTGKIVHMKGTVDLGFTDITVLPNADKWTTTTSDAIQNIIDWYYSMEYRPDAIFMGLTAMEAFTKNIAQNIPTGMATNPKFKEASLADADRKSPKTKRYNDAGKLVDMPSKHTRFIGTIVPIGLDVYVETGKYIDSKGVKHDNLETNSILMAPVGNKNSARWYYASIPTTEIVQGVFKSTWKHQKRRFYNGVNDNGVTGFTGLLTSFVPVMRNPKHFKLVKVA